MSSRAAIGFLTLEQRLIHAPNEIDGAWDVVLTAVSWETRGATTARFLAAQGKTVKVFRFLSTSSEMSERKDIALRTISDECGNNIEVVELGPSRSSEQNFVTLGNLVEGEYQRKGRPLTVLIDSTCLPKKYLLFLLGACFRKEWAARVAVLYAEGRYAEPMKRSALGGGPRGYISEGDWSSVQVPYLESSSYAPRTRDVVVSLGSEVGMAIPLVERLVPRRRLTLIQITDDESRVPRGRLDNERKYVDILLQQPDATARHYDLNDAVSVARDVLGMCQGATTCVAVGSKPHALALGVAALADDRIEVVCRVPGGYVVADVEATGQVTMYSIEDRFEPLAYLTDVI